MALPPLSDTTVSSHFFEPVIRVFNRLTTSRQCSELSDLEFITLGVSRVLSQATSGRDFLQAYADSGHQQVGTGHFFETLKSQRRLGLCAELNELLQQEVAKVRDDPFAAFPELAGFDIHAGDGHYHGAAAHDKPIGDAKRPVGHFFMFNLRSCALHHLELGEAGEQRKHEHDMRVLKRTAIKTLRRGAGKGRKVLVVWDRAGIDFQYWAHAKQNSVYFISRQKDNMRLEIIGINAFERSDPRNQGVISDELVSTSMGVYVRRVVYHDPVDDVTYTYLTSETRLPPGLVALIYKRRWDIEKAFDETENKLQEGKAWASSPTAKKIQGQLIAITFNLLLLIEVELEKAEQIHNTPAIHRRIKRMEEIRARLAKIGATIPFVFSAIQRITQRGLKLIRWLRNHLYGERPWSESLGQLRRLYAAL